MKQPQILQGLLVVHWPQRILALPFHARKERDHPSLPRHSFSFLFSPIPRVGVSSLANETTEILPGRGTDPTNRAQMVQEQQSLANRHVGGQHFFPNRIPQQE